MIGLTSRSILHLVAHIEAARVKKNTTRDIWTMTEILDALLNCGLPQRIQWGKEGCLELLQVQLHAGHAVLLLSYSDKGVSDPAFRDPDSGKQRVVRKRAGEGVAHAVHLVVSTENTSAKSYRALLEVAPRTSRTPVLRLLNKLLSQCEDLQRGTAKRVLSPKLSFDGDASSSLKQSLLTGTLHGIDLVRDQRADEGATGEPSLVPVEIVHSFKVVGEKSTRPKPLRALRSMLMKAQQLDFQAVRVCFTDADTDKRQTFELSVDADLDREDEFFVRRTTIDPGVMLDAAPEAIVPEISTAMVALLGMQ